MQNNNIQKEWSNPTPAGLVALSVACVCFFAMLTGRVETSAMPLIGCWLIGGFFVQVIVGLLDLKGGNSTGGNTFLFFSAFFMLTGGLEMLLKYNAILSGAALDARIDGYAWSVLAAVLLLWTPAFLKNFSLLSIVVLLLDVALPFIALVDLNLIPGECGHIAAWALLFAGFVAIYLCAATIVNQAYGKTIYPVIGAK
ncbi:GPR1/FUN34/YaaH family transporter [Christensenellaceae bacterium OttesenSCG-928-M15]|nr:GPR1/FUN34/YaaH family transporter [Christensenellaceae bacterium OttesenSCG-928-M15]